MFQAFLKQIKQRQPPEQATFVYAMTKTFSTKLFEFSFNFWNRNNQNRWINKLSWNRLWFQTSAMYVLKVSEIQFYSDIKYVGIIFLQGRNAFFKFQFETVTTKNNVFFHTFTFLSSYLLTRHFFTSIVMLKF